MKAVLINLDDENYKTISELAKISDMTVTAYITKKSTELVSIDIDYDSIHKHTEQITELKNIINNISKTINNTDEIYNADIKNIYNVLNDILNSEKEFLNNLQKDRKSKSTLIKRTIKNEIKKITKEGDEK